VASACIALLACCAATALGGGGGHQSVNGKIAFTIGDDIYVMNPDGANKTNLTDSKEIDEQARFSPDGQTIAFLSTPVDGFISTGRTDVYVMNVDGTNVRKVTSAATQIESLNWTADGARLLYYANLDNKSNNSEIYSIAPDGTGQSVVTDDGPHMDGAMTMSTASNKITFAGTVGNSTNSEVYIVNTDGTGFSRLTNDPGFDDDPVINRSGARVAWTTDRHNPADTFDTSSEIYAISVDGTGQQRLTTGPGIQNTAVEYSPDGTQIGINREGFAGVMGVDGSNPHDFGLGGNDHFYFFAQWSPDGQRIAIDNVLPRGGEDPHFTIQTIAPDGTQRQNLTSEADDAVYSDWQDAETLPPDPPLTLTASAKKKQKAKGLRATVECSNECELSIKATGRAGGDRFKSKFRAHLYGSEESSVRVLKRKVARAIDGERGKVKIKLAATDDFANAESAKLKAKLKR
jgi:TolB protein